MPHEPVRYVPDNLDEIDSEVVRHAAPVEQPVPPPGSHARGSEGGHSSTPRDRALVPPDKDEPQSIETVSSSMNITYDAEDLEIPAFLRKRGEN
jgi:hypothetical protein